MPRTTRERRLTIADLLSEGSLRLQLVGGSKGVRAPIAGVHISEMPDPTPWLARGDLLLSTGLAFHDDPQMQVDLVRRLKHAGMTGLGVAIGIYLDHTSQAMRTEADAQGLPLFEVPLEVPFKSITGLVYHSLYSSDFYQARRNLSVQDRLLALLLEERGIDHLVSSVAVLLSTSVLVFDALGQVVSQAYARSRLTPQLRDEVWRQYAEHGCGQAAGLRGQPIGDHEVFFEEVRLGGRVELVLCLIHPRTEVVSDVSRVIPAYMAKLLTLEMHRERDEFLLQERMRAGLLDDILSASGRQDDLLDRLARFGFTAGRPLTLVLCDIAGFLSGVEHSAGLEVEESLQRLKIEFKNAVDGFFSDQRVPFISLAKSDAVIVLLQAGSAEREALRALGRALLAHLAEALPDLTVTIGFGESYEEPDQIPRALTQAREAKSTRGDSGPHGRVRLFSDLGPRVRLLETQTPERLEYFVDSTLGPLLAHDAERGERLLPTLAVYLEADRSIGRSAARLFVHPNTLRNRLKRTEELLGLSLESTDVLVDVALALEAMRILGKSPSIT